ncbi:DUF3560 domain-containing protein [Pedobacter sp. UC225_65]|uniref:DUF3560 domain-containing protein n=1 Tax=Pedobacter sp. UC225_65 TaxID=3350173 RepID=UPI003670D692
MKHDFEQRRQKRVENAENRAAKNAGKSDRLWQKANRMADVIPMGQPILVGHHSEKSDRKYRGKIDSMRRKSIEAMEKAAYYERKAESIRSNDAISSDDPDALEKLKAKLKRLEESAEFMKKANVFIKKRNKEGFLALPMASVEIWDELTSGRYGSVGYEHFKFSNNSAERRRIKKRIDMLKSQKLRPAIDRVINGARLFENREAGRLQIIFDGKPSQMVISVLKQAGFRWSPSMGAWQRHISQSAYNSAKDILESLSG